VSDIACTEIVYRFDFPNPPTLLDLWRDYIHEHARPLGQDVRALVYIAKGWFHVMGIDAAPGAGSGPIRSATSISAAPMAWRPRRSAAKCASSKHA
jgi:hypothetical protein